MNLKDRGVTVGGLLIISIIIISAFFIINKVQDGDNKSEIYMNSNYTSRVLIS